MKTYCIGYAPREGTAMELAHEALRETQAFISASYLTQRLTGLPSTPNLSFINRKTGRTAGLKAVFIWFFLYKVLS